MSTPVVGIKDLSFSYNSKNAILKNISFDLFKSEILGIIGPNGGGKTTLLKILVGQLKPSSGNINISADNISYVPQVEYIETILPINVIDYINFGLIGHKHESKDLNDVLEIVGITEFKNHNLSELSGGQKQRCLLAKAIIKNPQLIILDEPTKGLDSIGQDQLLKLIIDIKTKFQTTIILVDHNINQIMKYCDKILCLNKTQHWHNKKELLNHGIIENIFSCEFEHRLIHENPNQYPDHECNHSKKREDHDS